MPTKSKEQSLDLSLESLEEIVEKLESGECSLDESIKLFESGVKLYKTCKTKLLKVEKKIQVLTDSLKEEDL